MPLSLVELKLRITPGASFSSPHPEISMSIVEQYGPFPQLKDNNGRPLLQI